MYIIDSRFAGLVLAGIFIAIAIVRYVRDRKRRLLIDVLFGGYLGVVLGYTLFPIDIPPQKIGGADPINGVNFDVTKMFDYASEEIAFSNICGNALLLMPLVMLGVLGGYRIFKSIRGALIFAVVFPVIIEGLQYLECCYGFAFGRSLDINDVILNGGGAIIAYAIIRIIMSMNKRKVTIFNRRELLVTLNMEEHYKVRDVLAAGGIPYYVRTDNIGGDVRGYRGNTGMNQMSSYEYIIYVRREDYEEAVYQMKKR